jgi:hypothetical protein
MKIKEELQEIYKQEANTPYCCYCLQPQDDKIGCCQENHFVAFKYLNQQDQQQIAEEILNG